MTTELMEAYRPTFTAILPKPKRAEEIRLPAGFEPLKWRVRWPVNVNLKGGIVFNEEIQTFATPRAREEFFALAERTALAFQRKHAQPLFA